MKQAEAIPDKSEREASCVESRQAEAGMPEYLEKTRFRELERKAQALTSLPRDENVSGTFGRPGIFELDEHGEMIVHVARTFDKNNDASCDFLPKPGKSKQPDEVMDTGTMQALAKSNVFFKTLVEIRKKIEQFMPAGIQRDSAIKQLKIDGTESLKNDFKELKLQNPQREIENEGGTLPAITQDKLDKLKNSEVNEDKAGQKIAAIEKATEMLVEEIKRLHGIENTSKFKIGRDDLGYALGVYLLSPNLASALGEKETRRFGQNMLVFGIAPAFGLTQEAQLQVTKHANEAIAEGSGSFLAGSAIGMILEGHPAIASITTAVLGVAFIGDQLFTPKNQARNAEVLQFMDRSGKANGIELFDMCNRSRELLGPESYHLTLDFATGGLGVANGRSAGKALEINKRMSVVAEKAKEVAIQISKLPEEVLGELLSLCGHNPHRPALATVQGEIILSRPTGRELPEFPEMNEPLKMVGRSDGSRFSTSLKTETVANQIKELEPDITKHQELLNRWDNLAGTQQYEERAILIQELLREKRFDTTGMIDLEIVFHPLKIEYLNTYKNAVTIFLHLENFFPKYKPNEIALLRKEMARDLNKFSLEVKSGSDIDLTILKIENNNRSVEFVGEKSEIIFKPGIYEYTLEKLERDFATNKTRKDLFEDIKRLAKELKHAGCEILYIDGSFITRKEKPGDYDACWEPFVKKNMPANTLLLEDSTFANTWRKERFSGDIFPRFGGYGDRVEKWQLDSRTNKQKGIIFIDLRRN